MDKRMRNLWTRALDGSAGAYRKLGICFLQGRRCRKDKKLAGACLRKAAELGDEAAYLLYHRLFSKNKKIIDDRSYAQMRKEYQNTDNQEKKRMLARYLSLGTKRQKRHNMTNKR